MHTWRVRRTPHTNLWRLATHHHGVVESKLASKDATGINYDSMSAVIALAFSVEAILNFVGERKLQDEWDERAGYYKKVKALETRLNFEYKKQDEPFRTLEMLKNARDAMAHGKPVEFAISASSNNEIARAMQPEWSDATAPAAAIAAYTQVSTFKDFLLRRARIKPSTEFTSAASEG